MATYMIRYSIIVPHYESLDTLPRALESVPEREDIEVLVIDNSKTPIDNTLFAQRKNVRLYYSPYGKGAGAARNVGLEHAMGQWLIMLDADDFFSPNAFETIDKYSNADADIVFFCAADYNADMLVISDRMSNTNRLIDSYQQTKEETSLRYGWSSPCAKMIKRSMVTEHAIRFEETQVANDVLFSAQTGYWAKHIVACQETIYCATIRHGSLTQTPTLSHLNGRIKAATHFNAFLKANGIGAPRMSIMYYIYVIARNYGMCEAFRALWSSVRAGNNPFYGISRWINTIRYSK